jgi:hypothetical protein
MKNYLVFLFLSLNITFSYAHQPDIASTFLIEQEDNNWVFQMRGALTAFQYAVKINYPDTTYATPEEFQAFVLEFVKENLIIRFNGQDSIRLENGFVKLGHETNVLFNVTGIPKNINSVFFKNSAFKDISRSQNALVILKKDFEKDQFILTKKNNHTVNLLVNNAKFVEQKVTTPSLNQALNYTPVYIFMVAFLLVVLGLIYFQFRE